MKVYTRTGDKGETSLFNGTRVPKNHTLIEAYGTVDECNATIGLATSLMTNQVTITDPVFLFDLRTLVSRLQTIQQYMFDLGAHLATPQSSSPMSKVARTKFSPDAATQLEAWIDDMDPKLPKLTTFVLPGGHPSAATLHQARTIARRAERNVTPLFLSNENEIDASAYRFLNRLSDFLFVASRFANHILGCKDVTWSKLTDSTKNIRHAPE